jgi:hypothetical protein
LSHLSVLRASILGRSSSYIFISWAPTALHHQGTTQRNFKKRFTARSRDCF